MPVAALSQASRRSVRVTSRAAGGRARGGAGRRRAPAAIRSSAGLSPAREHSSACSRAAYPGCASAREKSSMAGDPELPRFGGRIARLHEDGQSGTVHPMTGAHIAFPSQHLRQVLHFVCELRGSRAAGVACRPGFADFTNEVQHLLQGVLQCEGHIGTSAWRNAASLPSAAQPGNRSGKSRQLWIARHRASLAS